MAKQGTQKKPDGLPGQGTGVVRPARLGDVVYDELLDRLLSQEIPPGERISVDEMVRKLGVSQTPIREALARLEAQGLVTSTHLVGYRAQPRPTKAQFQEIFDARLLIEPAVARKAASAFDQDSAAQLERIIGQANEVIQGRRERWAAQVAQLDSKFHGVIAARGGNSLIAAIVANLHTKVQFILLRERAQSFDPLAADREHRAIYEALKRRDPSGAERAMKEHLHNSRKRYWHA
jgi:DNA-binding GntR family transcriptional regulator